MTGENESYMYACRSFEVCESEIIEISKMKLDVSLEHKNI